MIGRIWSQTPYICFYWWLCFLQERWCPFFSLGNFTLVLINKSTAKIFSASLYICVRVDRSGISWDGVHCVFLRFRLLLLFVSSAARLTPLQILLKVRAFSRSILLFLCFSLNNTLSCVHLCFSECLVVNFNALTTFYQKHLQCLQRVQGAHEAHRMCKFCWKIM